MKVTGIICKIKNYVNVRLLKGIYYALAFPYIIYGNLVWGITYPSRLNKISKIQKKIVCLLTFSNYTDSTEPLFKKLEFLNVYQLNDYLTGIFMFKKANNDLPSEFMDYFKTNIDIHSHNTRNAKLLQEQTMENIPLETKESKFGTTYLIL